MLIILDTYVYSNYNFSNSYSEKSSSTSNKLSNEFQLPSIPIPKLLNTLPLLEIAFKGYNSEHTETERFLPSLYEYKKLNKKLLFNPIVSCELSIFTT